jgi:arylsulfatase
MQRIPRELAPMIIGRSFTITAEVDCMPGDRGVLVAHGDVNGGYALWLSEKGLEFEYNDLGQRHRVSGPFSLTQGEHVFALQVDKTGEQRDRATLAADGETVGIGEIGRTARYMISWQGLSIGEDQLSPVSPEYPRGSRFTGTLRHVEYTLNPDG